MKRLLLLCAPAGFLLSSATPPPFELAALEAETVLDAYPLCAEGRDCTELAGGETDFAPIPSAEAAPRLAAADPPPPELAVSPPPARLPETKEPEEESPPPPPSTEGLRVLVSIPQQKLYVFEDGELVDTSPVSTGKRGHETPVGTFRILQKKVHHRSNKYANAPMPYMQRLTYYGIAIHAGSLPGYPASHGCIRLPRSFAKKLYGLTEMGTQVTITRQRPKSAEEALTLV